MSLTESVIKRTTVMDRTHRLSDGGGLYLLINPDGSRWWRMDYRYQGKRKTLSMGVYPQTSLKQARERRDVAGERLAAGFDPSHERKTVALFREHPLAQTMLADTRKRIRKHASGGKRSLDVVGIDVLEEQAYRALLGHRMATLDDVAHIMDQPARKIERVLGSLEAKGLVSHSPERPRRYIAAPPELAVEALVIQRQADLERVRSTILELKEQVVAADSDQHLQIVEIITSRAGLDQAIKQILHTVTSDLITFQRAPIVYATGFFGTEGRFSLPKGVRVRSISDEGYLSLPGAINSLRSDSVAGEEPRAFPQLPVKMIVADRCLGLIPLDSNNPDSPVLLVRGSSLLDSLCALFEMIWERATPLAFGSDGSVTEGEPLSRVSSGAERIVLLLAAGLNDKAIAHEAGISINTLTRRIAELMRHFNTRTRFQLGWQAAIQAFPKNTQGGS